MNYAKLVLLIFSLQPLLFAPKAADKFKALEDKENLIHVAIIGSGPAGLSAAIPAARSGYHTVIFQGPKPGGELMDAAVVENWPGIEKTTGAHCMEILEKQVLSFGPTFVPATVTDIDFSAWPYKLTLDDGTIAHALTLILATGASQKKLGIEGEDTYWGHGLFSCGMCDSSFTRGKETVVIGSGDIAIQRVLQLAPIAQKITLIVPGPRLTAHETMQAKLKGFKHVHIVLNKEVTKINGDGTSVSSVALKDLSTGEQSSLPTSSVFLSTRLSPNTELFRNKVTLDKYGCVELKDSRSQETRIEGVYAAGNVADPFYRQVAVISGDGTKASIDAVKQLSLWNLDTVARESLNNKLYRPTPLKHPEIKELQRIQEYRRIIRRSRLPLLVEFYSPTCPSCRKMEAPLYALAEKYKKMITILKVNKDKYMPLVEKEDLSLIPAFLIFMNGKEINRMEGETTKDKLFDFVASTLASASQE